ncbi:MAG: nucleotidyl transferase AbiEii/AbiGii toxin family protein [Planctomycetes bacterium]|nr:nucleotidyl transferase AbiEii/AbiGii toxin family protein [Planctomycetota bacterium]
MRSDLLAPLQRQVLDVLARTPHSFFLSGGAALGPFYLHHRTSADLDLFAASEQDFGEAPRLADVLVRETGLRATPERTGPSFRRIILESMSDALRLDFVFDVPPQIVTPKPVVNGVRIDSLEDIVCNKIGAILDRGEVRDLIDLFFLDRAGYRTQEWWRHTLRKEAGLTPEILAHQVSTVPVDAPWPRLVVPLDLPQLRAYRDDLALDLARQAFPRSPTAP